MELHVVISVELYKHAPGIFSVIGSNMMRFRPFSTVHTNTTERFQIDAFSMKTLSVCVVGRPKRIEMYAFSNENVLVWTGPNSGTTTTNLTKVQPNRELRRYRHWRTYLDLVEIITAKLSLSRSLSVGVPVWSRFSRPGGRLKPLFK